MKKDVLTFLFTLGFLFLIKAPSECFSETHNPHPCMKTAVLNSQLPASYQYALKNFAEDEETFLKALFSHTTETESPKEFVREISQRTLKEIWNGLSGRHPELVKKIEKVENTLTTEVQFSSDSQNEQRSIRLRLDPITGDARINYQGFLNARFEYEVYKNTFVISLEEKITENLTVRLEHREQQSHQSNKIVLSSLW